MFARLAAVSALALAALALAEDAGLCNTGSIQCCSSVVDPNSKEGSLVGSLLNLDLESVTAQVGINCSPITAVVGVDIASSCKATPVCCKDTQQGGALGVGCVPISL